MTKLAGYLPNLHFELVQAGQALLNTMPCPLDTSAFIDAFVPGDDVYVLQRAAEIVGGHHSNRQSVIVLPDGKSVAVHIYTAATQKKMLLPSEVAVTGEHAYEINEWADQATGLIRDVSRMRAFLTWATNANFSLEKLRPLVPGLPMLLADAKAVDMAEKLRPLTTLPPMPRLPPDVRAALRRGNELLAAASMLDRENTDYQPNGRVVVVPVWDKEQLDMNAGFVDYGIKEEVDDAEG